MWSHVPYFKHQVWLKRRCQNIETTATVRWSTVYPGHKWHSELHKMVTLRAVLFTDQKTLSVLLLPLYCDWKQKIELDLSKSKKSDLDIVEHSMCQPGRPFPQGEFQDSSWGLAAFHRAKSLPCRLSESTGKNKWFVNGICLKEKKLPNKSKRKCVFSELLWFFNPLQSPSFHYNFPLIQGKSEILKYWNIEIDFDKLQRWIQDSLIHPILSVLLSFPGLPDFSFIWLYIRQFPQDKVTAQQQKLW